MNTSNSNETPSFDLPQPNSEAIAFGGGPKLEVDPIPMNAEVQSIQTELPQSAVPTAFTTPPPVAQTTQSVPIDPALSVIPSPAKASKATDLIEKEWVLRAKAIVERTKSDPYTQNEELKKFKADFMKTKYNKDLKVSET